MNIESLINWISIYIAPVFTLSIGVLILGFVGFINWYSDLKTRSIKWIAKKVYRDGVGSETLADNLFMTITSFLLAIGGIIVLVSLLFF